MSFVRPWTPDSVSAIVGIVPWRPCERGCLFGVWMLWPDLEAILWSSGSNGLLKDLLPKCGSELEDVVTTEVRDWLSPLLNPTGAI